ncbi:MAG: hypothetical protein FWF70_07325 [Bacteroidetes bacterium]|nr:hypothetical protein [Bacteroidota bacterium]MCL1968860.1 hypothetical protein [Bacteroidota bacterium]
MKRTLMTVLSCILIMGMAACGSQNKNNNTSENSQDGKTENVNDDNGAAKYFKIFSSENYHLKAKMVGDKQISIMEMFMKDKNNMATIVEMEGHKMKTILKGGKMHIVDDVSKTVMITKVPQSSNDNNSIKTDGMTLTDSGTAEFNGKTLPYKEYSDKDGNRVQYFLDGTKLAGIRNIARGNVMDIIVLELDENVPNNVFDIPSNYQKMEY